MDDTASKPDGEREKHGDLHGYANSTEDDLSEASDRLIFMENNVVKELLKMGTTSDLFMLRQVNQEYYEMLNTFYLNTLDIGIRIVSCSDSNEERFYNHFLYEDPEGGFEEKAEKDNEENPNKDLELQEPSYINELKEELDIAQTDISNPEQNDEDCSDESESQMDPNCTIAMLDTDGNFIKRITHENWTIKIAHIFRKMIIDDSITTFVFERKKFDLKDAAVRISPHITTLDLVTDFPRDLGKSVLDYNFAKFLHQFTSLKHLSLSGVGEGCYPYKGDGITFHQPRYIPMNELEIVLDSLKTRPNISIQVCENQEAAINTFSTKPNTQIILKFSICHQLEQIENCSNRFGHLKNVKYSFHSWIQNSITKLQNLAAFSGKHGSQIEELDLSVEFHESGGLEGIHQLTFKSCLVQLSPFLTKFKVHQYQKIKLDILNTDSEFPKLKELEIDGYQHPLEILKNCPKLKYLKLRTVDHNLCIFTNPQQTDHENLAAYFGNLTKLKELSFLDRVKKPETIEINEGNQYDEKLRKILPAKLKYIYYDYEENKHRCCRRRDSEEESEEEPERYSDSEEEAEDE